MNLSMWLDHLTGDMARPYGVIYFIDHDKGSGRLDEQWQQDGESAYDMPGGSGKADTFEEAARNVHAAFEEFGMTVAAAAAAMFSWWDAHGDGFKRIMQDYERAEQDAAVKAETRRMADPRRSKRGKWRPVRKL